MEGGRGGEQQKGTEIERGRGKDKGKERMRRRDGVTYWRVSGPWGREECEERGGSVGTEPRGRGEWEKPREFRGYGGR